MKMSFLYKESTIKWCEDKNVYSDYIIEWYNALTGICLSLSGVLFYLNNRNNIFISKFNETTIILIILGIGTVLFHSTLLYIFQLVDEIPMLLLCFEYIKFLNLFNREYELTDFNEHDMKDLNRFIYIYSMFIVIIGFIYDTLQVILFQSLIILFVVYILKEVNHIEKYNLFLFNKLLKYKNYLNQCHIYHYNVHEKLVLLKNNIKFISDKNEKLKKYKHYFYICGVLSLFVWFVDNLFCDKIKYYKFYFNGHALWHIFSSIGIYYSNKIMIIQYNICYWYRDINKKSKIYDYYKYNDKNKKLI